MTVTCEGKPIEWVDIVEKVDPKTRLARQTSEALFMTDDELLDALDGLHAYDVGCVDSGIKDEVLRSRVKQEIANMISDGRRECQLVSDRFSLFCGRLVQQCLSEEAVRSGYGYEDWCEMLKWLQNEMGVPV